MEPKFVFSVFPVSQFHLYFIKGKYVVSEVWKKKKKITSFAALAKTKDISISGGLQNLKR